MVCKMVASKLLCVVGLFLVLNYAAGKMQCFEVPIRPQCPATWSHWHDKCYKVHDAAVTWEEGKQICVEMGDVMVVPQSEEELQHLLNMCSCNKIWIGCNDIQTAGTWVCLDGEGTIDVQDERWEDDQPNDFSGDQDCAAGGAAGWSDMSCPSTYTLICQRPVSASLLLL